MWLGPMPLWSALVVRLDQAVRTAGLEDLNPSVIGGRHTAGSPTMALRRYRPGGRERGTARRAEPTQKTS